LPYLNDFRRSVNRTLRQLTMTKQLWIFLVEDLVANFLVEFPRARSLDEHSVEELIAFVKRTVTGHATWSLPDTSPALADEITHPEPFLSVDLLPRGQYVLVKRLKEAIELWNGKGKQLLWTKAISRALTSSNQLDIGYFHSHRRFEIDVGTGESHESFHMELSQGFTVYHDTFDLWRHFGLRLLAIRIHDVRH
jgi:hypothetical protein